MLLNVIQLKKHVGLMNLKKKNCNDDNERVNELIFFFTKNKIFMF